MVEPSTNRVRESPRVLIGAPESDARAELSARLKEEGLDVCGEAGTAAAVISAASTLKPDICLIDSALTGGAVEAATRISKEVVGASIVIISGTPTEGELFDAIMAGSVGYLPLGTDQRAIAAALRGVSRREAAVPRSLAARIVDNFRNPDLRSVPIPGRGRVRFTARELEIVELLLRGLSTAAIAHRLFVTPVTVRSHIAAVVRKTGASNRDGAMSILRSLHD